ncbi:MAG: 4-alpha-glucanotransferase [Acidobacteria bacterium]|nr:4-alpha-glucanotransferase [Acidobacteriota bacterium]
MRDRLQRVTGAPDDASVDEVIIAAHHCLAQSHSRVLLATLEDALAVTDRPNQPGTVQDTNWSRALPLPIEDLEDEPRAAAIGEALSRRS